MSLNPIKVMKALALTYCDTVTNEVRECSDLSATISACSDENEAQAIYHTSILVSCLPNVVARIENLREELTRVGDAYDEKEAFQMVMRILLV